MLILLIENAKGAWDSSHHGRAAPGHSQSCPQRCCSPSRVGGLGRSHILETYWAEKIHILP